MLTRSMMAMATLAALSAPLPLWAQGRTDPMRCEARRMRCDSQKFECLVRCDKTTGSSGAATAAQSKCEQSCDKRAKKVMDRIEQNPPCVAVPGGGGVPGTCEARLLRVGAANLVCASRCTDQAQGNAAFDLDACRATCEDRCNTSSGDILASPICSKGRIGTDPVCGPQ